MRAPAGARRRLAPAPPGRCNFFTSLGYSPGMKPSRRVRLALLVFVCAAASVVAGAAAAPPAVDVAADGDRIPPALEQVGDPQRDPAAAAQAKTSGTPPTSRPSPSIR